MHEITGNMSEEGTSLPRSDVETPFRKTTSSQTIPQFAPETPMSWMDDNSSYNPSIMEISLAGAPSNHYKESLSSIFAPQIPLSRGSVEREAKGRGEDSNGAGKEVKMKKKKKVVPVAPREEFGQTAAPCHSTAQKKSTERFVSSRSQTPPSCRASRAPFYEKGPVSVTHTPALRARHERSDIPPVLPKARRHTAPTMMSSRSSSRMRGSA